MYLFFGAILYFVGTVMIDFLQQSVWFRQKFDKNVAERERDDPINRREQRDDAVVAEEEYVKNLGGDSAQAANSGLFVKNINKTFFVNQGK
jgi:hypothetical protein